MKLNRFIPTTPYNRREQTLLGISMFLGLTTAGLTLALFTSQPATPTVVNTPEPVTAVVNTRTIVDQISDINKRRYDDLIRRTATGQDGQVMDTLAGKITKSQLVVTSQMDSLFDEAAKQDGFTSEAIRTWISEQFPHAPVTDVQKLGLAVQTHAKTWARASATQAAILDVTPNRTRYLCVTPVVDLTKTYALATIVDRTKDGIIAMTYAGTLTEEQTRLILSQGDHA